MVSTDDATVPPSPADSARSLPTARAARGTSSLGGPAWYVVLPLFVVAAWWMTFRSVGRLDSHVVGDSADALLVMWILGWVQHALPQGWQAVWDTNMFFPAGNTLAYADSLLSIAIVQWPLRAVFGRTLGLNIMAIGAQTATLWFTYRLALRLTSSWPAALVAAVMFGFSTPLLSQFGHQQLLLSVWLVPLTLLALVRYLETSALRVALGLGLAFAALIMSATYYALMTACGIGVIVAGYVLWTRPRELWRFLRGLVVAAAVAVVLILPVAVQYVSLQDDPHFERGFVPEWSAHVRDFLAPDAATYVMSKMPVLDHYAQTRGFENRLYPGLLTVAFFVVGAVALFRVIGRRRRSDSDEDRPGGARWRARVAVLIALGGLATTMLAFGDEVRVLGHVVPLPFKVLRRYAPGFGGIRVTARFAVFGQLALAMVAAFGVRSALSRIPRRSWMIGAIALCALVMVEAARTIPLVEVPDSRRDEAVNRYLEPRPDGVVLELPIHGAADGAAWPYTEAPRLFVSLGDWNQRVNGYSGFTPPGYDADVPVLNEFPGPAAMQRLDELGVRYVVLRTRVLGDQRPEHAPLLAQDGAARFTPATARQRIREIPPERVRRVAKIAGAYVVELRPEGGGR